MLFITNTPFKTNYTIIFLDLLQGLFFHWIVTVFPLLSVSSWNKTILKCWYYTAWGRRGGLTKRACVVLFTEHKAALMGFSGSRQTVWLLTYQSFCSNSTDWIVFSQTWYCYSLIVYNWGFIIIFMHCDGLKTLLSIYPPHFLSGALQHTCYMCLHTQKCSHSPNLPALPVWPVIVEPQGSYNINLFNTQLHNHTTTSYKQ